MLRYYFMLSVINIVLVKCYEEAGGSQSQKHILQKETVSLKLLYESLCPYCIEFDSDFVSVATKLYNYLEVHTYPYGNAQMTKNKDGSVTVECQHGVPECYGNMLHACALDTLADDLLALQFNACMMELRSNDTAADSCGQNMKIPVDKVETIKKCAKGPKGHELLVHYGEESKQVNFSYVPYVLINSAEWNGETEDFMKDVCAAFKEPPPPCSQDNN